MGDPISSVTSLQCVAALRDLGFSIEDVDARTVILQRHGRRVFVRRHSTLSPNEVRAILMAATVTRAQFLDVIARR